MRFGPTPAIYAGVFVAVGMLEIAGTAIGTWGWRPIVPGTTVTSGNPPSGAIAGYALFDICAMLLAPLFLRLVTRERGPRARSPTPPDSRLCNSRDTLFCAKFGPARAVSRT